MRFLHMSRPLLLLALLLVPSLGTAAEPIPDKLVVLTFDDSVKSHFTIVRPILKKYQFGPSRARCKGWIHAGRVHLSDGPAAGFERQPGQ